jgi:hypothetical protein
MATRIGRLEHIIRRMLIESKGQPIRTSEIVRRCYKQQPRTFPGRTKFEIWHHLNARKAAMRWAIPIGRSDRGAGRSVIWAPKPALAALLRDD